VPWGPQVLIKYHLTSQEDRNKEKMLDGRWKILDKKQKRKSVSIAVFFSSITDLFSSE